MLQNRGVLSGWALSFFANDSRADAHSVGLPWEQQSQHTSTKAASIVEVQAEVRTAVLLSTASVTMLRQAFVLHTAMDISLSSVGPCLLVTMRSCLCTYALRGCAGAALDVLALPARSAPSSLGSPWRCSAEHHCARSLRAQHGSQGAGAQDVPLVAVGCSVCCASVCASA